MRVILTSTVALLVAASSWGSGNAAIAQDLKVLFRVIDTTIYPTPGTVHLPVRLDNYDDSVGAVQFWLSIEPGHGIVFDFSSSAFDTAGTLLSGWESVAAVDSTGTGLSYKFTAQANTVPPPYVPGFGPQSGGILLRIPLTFTPDSVLPGPTRVTISIDHRLEFATPRGILLGAVTNYDIDTFYFACTEWAKDICVDWDQVDPDSNTYDSVVIDSALAGYVDSTVVRGVPGSVTFSGTTACDANLDAVSDLSDVLCVVSSVFFKQTLGPGCLYFGGCDLNGDGLVDLTDILTLVNLIFLQGASPES